MRRKQIEVQDIMKKYGSKYKEEHKIRPHIQKAMNAIEKCRTGELGAHEDVCDECGFTKISYNSCRNRHCPKCQGIAREKWIYDREFEILNVKYFHVVFTIPSELYAITKQNERKVYNILFKATAETLQELSQDKKYLGAEIGFMEVLHTWGQTLVYHPHIHCIVPAGGMDKIGKWRNSKKKFFIPVKVLSRKFRGKFLYYLKQEKLEFYGKNKEFENKQNFEELIARLYNKEWIVYCNYHDIHRTLYHYTNCKAYTALYHDEYSEYFAAGITAYVLGTWCCRIDLVNWYGFVSRPYGWYGYGYRNHYHA